MARLNSMYRSIGSMAQTVLRGATPLAPPGMRGPASARLAATKASQIKTGKRVVGGAAAMGMMGMANRKDPVSSYNPRRPVMPVPQNGRPM
jgi:hypothetical protein